MAIQKILTLTHLNDKLQTRENYRTSDSSFSSITRIFSSLLFTLIRPTPTTFCFNIWLSFSRFKNSSSSPSQTSNTIHRFTVASPTTLQVLRSDFNPKRLILSHLFTQKKNQNYHLLNFFCRTRYCYIPQSFSKTPLIFKNLNYES